MDAADAATQRDQVDLAGTVARARRPSVDEALPVTVDGGPRVQLPPPHSVLMRQARYRSARRPVRRGRDRPRPRDAPDGATPDVLRPRRPTRPAWPCVTLNDPDRRNALNLDLCDELVAAIDELEADDGVGAVVVTGAPPAFCAGADLSQLGASPTRRAAARSTRASCGSARSHAAHHRRGQRRRRRRRHEPGAGVRRARSRRRRARFDTRFLRPRHPPRRRPHLDDAPHRRAAGDRRRWCCSARCSTAPRPSASASCGAASTTTTCSTPRSPWPRRAARGATRAGRSGSKAHDQRHGAPIDDHDAGRRAASSSRRSGRWTSPRSPSASAAAAGRRSSNRT